MKLTTKKDWLVGSWQTDSSVVLEIIEHGKTLKVRAFDKHDKEEFIISKTRWNGKSLRFETYVPSTEYRTRNCLTPISKTKFIQELTMWESWEKLPLKSKGERKKGRAKSGRGGANNSEQSQILFLKADTLLDQKKYDQARQVYSELIALQKTDIAFVNRGLASWELGYYEEAIKDYRRALKINPINAVAYRSIGELLLKKEESRKAVYYFRKAIKLKPDYSAALTGLGIAYYQLEKWVKCYENLSAAVKIDPQNHLALKGLKRLEEIFELTM